MKFKYNPQTKIGKECWDKSMVKTITKYKIDYVELEEQIKDPDSTAREII